MRDWSSWRHLVVVPVWLVWAWQSPATPENNARIRERLANPAPLSSDEIGQVLEAARAAAAQKTFWVSSSFAGTPGFELLLGSDGRPVLIRVISGIDTSGPSQPARHVTVEVVTQYLRQAAFYCDGSPAPGELVAEYENVGDGWTVSMRHSMRGSEELAWEGRSRWWTPEPRPSPVDWRAVSERHRILATRADRFRGVPCRRCGSMSDRSCRCGGRRRRSARASRRRSITASFSRRTKRLTSGHRET